MQIHTYIYKDGIFRFVHDTTSTSLISIFKQLSLFIDLCLNMLKTCIKISNIKWSKRTFIECIQLVTQHCIYIHILYIFAQTYIHVQIDMQYQQNIRIYERYTNSRVNMHICMREYVNTCICTYLCAADTIRLNSWAMCDPINFWADCTVCLTSSSFVYPII